MNNTHFGRLGVSRWIVSVALALVTMGAAAQTAGSAEELRAALKKELAPLTLSIQEHARAVTSEIAANVVAELASNLKLGGPRAQLAQRAAPRRDADRS